MLELRVLTISELIIRLLLSCTIGLIIGLERGKKNMAAGLRTYTLVCLGSTIVMMTNQLIYQSGYAGDMTRMGAQVISGIGFLGAGSIIVTRRNQIKGVTTAAGLWTSACIGLAVGIGFYEVAVGGAVLIILIMTLMSKINQITRERSNSVDVFMEFKRFKSMSTLAKHLRNQGLIMRNLQVEEGVPTEHSFAFLVTISSIKKRSRDSILEELHNLPDLLYLEEI
ncbi:MAG: MgtC/SapB family protein [Saccharofermentanales bacterium]|jgi:putative Mg2+ transporter-C (MgtC) family protein